MKRYRIQLLMQADGSAILPLPEEIVSKHKLQEGVCIELLPLKDNRYELKLQGSKYDLDSLLSRINKDNCHGEIGFGEAQGKEII